MTKRLDWLDALRGYAALVVVCFHLSPRVIGSERHLAIYRHIDFGKYGVLLFFLVSGYVIPMSLERHGSLRRFWIGRLFRIYPAYLFAIAVVVAAGAAGWLAWQPSLRLETVTSVLAHATMMPDLVGHRGAVRVFWTLSYEMTFYLIVSGLFVWRLHRLSAWWAPALGLAALVLGRSLPNGLLGATFAERRITAGLLAVIIGLSVLAYVRDRLVALAGAAGVAFVLLPAVNGHATADSTVISSWQGLLLLAVMFAGTVVYRWQHGQVGGRAAAFSLTVVALSVIGAHWTHLGGTGAALRLWTANVGAVAVTFAFAYAMRNRTVPAPLIWLGRISYSLYLLHVVVLYVLVHALPDFGTGPLPVRVTAGLGYLILALLVAWLAYRMVEIPGQALGRKIAARLGPPPHLTTQRAKPGAGRGENVRQSV
ncbi:acyltransferase family protein [Actinoplanes sp. CA-030573]|uniref:acyltransferase family protein n=1 Tax=Actinoplanes sp. CA-030573 TaxID=3239898 RepID=UPI003D91C663